MDKKELGAVYTAEGRAAESMAGLTLSEGTDRGSHISMRMLPVSERPFEKCEMKGAGALSDEELLSVFLRSGTGKKRVTEVARDVLSKCEEYGGLTCLERIPVSELRAIEGIGAVRALQLSCLGELARRISSGKKQLDIRRMESPRQVFEYFSDELRSLEVEEVWALYLDGKNTVIKKRLITRGTVNGSLVSGREVYKEAVRCSAAGLILVHNHPSGDPEPSSDDIGISEELLRAGRLMDIDFLDHVIVGTQGYVSMKERGILG